MILHKKYISLLKNYYISHGYPIQEFNLFGVRNFDGIANDCINDELGYWTEDEVFISLGTTDSGKVGFIKGHNGGAATMCLGHHKKIWVIDRHNNKYEAFCNRKWKGCNKQRFIRDRNKNFILDPNECVQFGHIGLNFHRMSQYQRMEHIGPYSLGCQVVAVYKDFNHILKKAKSTDMYLRTKLPTTFNYMLFDRIEMPDLYNEISNITY